MTLLVALKGKDGLALAADSRGTFGDPRGVTAQNDSQEKAHILAPHVAALLAGSGEVGVLIVREVAHKLAALYETRKGSIPDFIPPVIEEVTSANFYGKGYQDILTRKPSIEKARTLLGWEPKVSVDEALRLTFEAFLEDWLRHQQ